MERVTTSLLVASCLIAVPALAADAPPASELAPVDVSATRLRSVPDFDVPASVTSVRMNPDSNQTQTDVTELLAGIAGVTALDRQNYAQDTQLSIRGFGSRATFGVRGLRLYADGIPASMPDGQGQLSHFSVLGADSMQIMRGPFSALYGNSSGGVVQVWSSPGTPDPSLRARATFGSNNTYSVGAQAQGSSGLVDYNLSLSHFETDGYREHSAARRDSGNLRLGFDLGDDRSLVLVANFVDIPEAQDTLGLTPADWRIDPQQAAAVATQYDTRKSVRQLQGGAIFEQRLGSHTLRASGYAGNREVVQFLAIPPTTQRNPAVASSQLHSGGVVDLDGDYRGADLRWSWVGELAGRSLELTAGSNFDQQKQLRRGYENFEGPPTAPTALGVRGNLRRDETNRVRNFDQFAQAWWHFADRWSVLAGVRNSDVKFRSFDRYITGLNGDDSGRKGYSDTTLVGGVLFQPVESLRLYVSTGDGFETPTFNELSYRADGAAGLALNLRPAASRNYEFGAKWRSSGGAQFDAAVFRASTKDDLVVVRNTGGRSSFGNVDRTRRQGLETSLRVPFARNWQVDATYTLMDAEFRSGYSTCLGVPCPTPNVAVPAGARIPGIPRHQGQVRADWSPGPWTAAVEFVARSRLHVRDVPDQAGFAPAPPAPGFGIWNAEIGRNFDLTHHVVRGFARVENVLDKTYVGSVIVNEGNSRFYESGTDRTAMIGVQWRWR